MEIIISSDSEENEEIVESCFNQYDKSNALLGKDLEVSEREALLQHKISSTEAPLVNAKLDDKKITASLISIQNQPLAVLKKEYDIPETSKTARVRQSTRPRKKPNWLNNFVVEYFE